MIDGLCRKYDRGGKEREYHKRDIEIMVDGGLAEDSLGINLWGVNGLGMKGLGVKYRGEGEVR